MDKKAALGAIILLFSAFVLIYLYLSSGGPDKMSDCGRYRTVYRTIYDDATGQEIALTRETASGIAALMKDCALERIPETVRADFLKAFPADAGAADTLARDVGILDAANNIAPSGSDPDNSRAIGRLIAERLGLPSDQVMGDRSKKDAGFSRSLMKTYVDNCKRNGVPIPPRLTEKPWKNFDLAKEKLFLLTDWTVNAWTYLDENPGSETENGFCIAMGRFKSTPGSSTTAAAGVFQSAFVGTICTDKFQKWACFFDNLKYDDKGKPKALSFEETVKTDYEQFVHPKDYSNVCTVCHIGGNPFVVKPNQPIAHAIPAAAVDPKDPGREPWFGIPDFGAAVPYFKNASKMPEDSKMTPCFTCHDLPEVRTKNGDGWHVNKEYCSTILAHSAEETMPPDEAIKAGWNQIHDTPYKESIGFLQKQCGVN